MHVKLTLSLRSAAHLPYALMGIQTWPIYLNFSITSSVLLVCVCEICCDRDLVVETVFSPFGATVSVMDMVAIVGAHPATNTRLPQKIAKRASFFILSSLFFGYWWVEHNAIALSKY